MRNVEERIANEEARRVGGAHPTKNVHQKYGDNSLALEIEAKFRVASHKLIRERLKAIRARFLERVLEQNEILDRPAGELQARGCGLRIREKVDENGKSVGATATYKGPRRPGPLKSREEIEIQVDDAAAARRIFAGLGFIAVLSYEKRRESWQLDDCRVELDEPPHIGLFVEIEGPGEAAIRSVQEKLGLNSNDIEPESYVSMLAAYCQREGIQTRTLRL